MTKEISLPTKDKVRSTLASIKAKLDKMEEAKNAGAKTNGLFHWNGREGMEANTNNVVKINSITAVAYLISILGFILTRKSEYDLAAEKLEMGTFPVFKWSGYQIDAWENDIKARINTINHSSEVEKLTKLRDDLSKYVSEEDRVEELLKQFSE